MRLSPEQKSSIVRRIGSVVFELRGSLYLFGSRADVRKKGGDIDLLALLPAANVTAFLEEKARLIDAVHGDLGEQRIDITVATAEQMRSDPFLASISDELIQLG